MGEMKFCNYWNLKGFDDPVKCRASKRRITMDRITNGKMKCCPRGNTYPINAIDIKDSEQ